MTASQKALGTPPGLAVMMVSERALKSAMDRTSPPTTFFGSFKKWLPIMKKYEARQPSYFATPPVQLIMALEVSLKQLVAGRMESRFEAHVRASNAVKDKLVAWGLSLVPQSRELAAHTLTAAYHPPGLNGPDFLKAVSSEGIVLAGGLHPSHAPTYFRVGHMNTSVLEGSKDVELTLNAIEKALKVCGYQLKSSL